jgi:hypothetical protein
METRWAPASRLWLSRTCSRRCRPGSRRGCVLGRVRSRRRHGRARNRHRRPEAIAAIAKGSLPKSGSARVDVLKEGEYLRIWFNHAGTHYIVNLPIDVVKGTDR